MLSTSRQCVRSLVKPPTLIQDAAKTAPPACGGMLHLGRGSHPYPRLPHPDCLPTQSGLQVRGPGEGCEALPGAPFSTQAYWPGEEGGCASRAGVQARASEGSSKTGSKQGSGNRERRRPKSSGAAAGAAPTHKGAKGLPRWARGWAGCAAAWEKWTGSEGVGGFARASKHSPDAAAVEKQR